MTWVTSASGWPRRFPVSGRTGCSAPDTFLKRHHMDRSIGLIVPVCDGPTGDERHFDRFRREITRLGLPFVVHFDHCGKTTQRFFTQHLLCLGASMDDDPESRFDESYRQRPLEVLLRHGFE